jgi:alpha-tubulin suppressor-like RCC1 family protein
MNDFDTRLREDFQLEPVETDWIDISAGPAHSLAMKADGTVWAWGATGYASPHQRVPFRIGAERTWKEAVAGSDYSLGVDANGILFAWGFTDLTNPAVAYVPQEISPTNRTDATWTNAGWTNGLAAYRRKIVALDTAGGLRIWGDAYGDYPGDSRTNPVAIPDDLDATRAWWDPERYEPGWIEREGPWLSVSGNSGTAKEGNAASGNLQPEGFAAAVRQDGTLWAWGANTNGQLGDGTRIPKDLPLRIGTANNWSSVEAGGSHILASRRDGSLWGWGANTNGELGLTTNLVRVTNNFSSGSTNTNNPNPPGFTGRTRTTTILLASNVHTPRPIFSKGWGVRGFSAGGSHSLVLGSNGTLWSMGANEQGQLGLGEVNRPAGGTNTNGSIRRAVTNLFTNIAFMPPRVETNAEVVEDRASLFKPRRVGRQLWKSIAAGDRHSLGVRQDGTLWAWGDNGNAQLGNGTLVKTSQPQQIGAGNRWAGVFAGKEHSLALQEDGSLWAWGLSDGRLGIPRPSPSYVPERVDFGPAGQATILVWTEGRSRSRLTGSGLAAFLPRSGVVNLSLALHSDERGKQEWSGQSEEPYLFTRGKLGLGKKISLNRISNNPEGGVGSVETNETGEVTSFLSPSLVQVPGRSEAYAGSATIDGISCRVQFHFDGDGDGDGIPDVADANPLGSAPRLASAKKARAILGKPFTYELTAEGGVVSPILGTTLSRLPQGLSYGPQEIQGVPVDDPANLGTYRVVVGARNEAGESFQTLSLDVVPPAPEITSADTLAWTQGISPFAFRITATNDSYPGYPVRYSATELPRGLRLDPASGWIRPGRGSPLDLPLPGSYRVRLVTAHAAGASTNFLNLTISPPGAGEWTAGAPLFYAARFLPGAMVSAAGLPAGLRIHPRTGQISGIPEEAGLFEVEVVSRSRTAIETNRVLLPIRTGRPELVGSGRLAFTGTAALSRDEYFRYQISARLAGQPWAGASDFPPRLSSDLGNARSFGAALTPGTGTLRYGWSSTNGAFASLEWNRPLPLDTAWQVSVDAGFSTNHLSGVLSGDESLALMLLALKDSSDLSGERDFVSTYLEGNTNASAGMMVAEAVVDGTTNGAVGVAAAGGQGVLSLVYQPTNLAAVSRTDAADTNSIWAHLQTNSLATWTNSAGSNSVILRLMGQSQASTNLVGLVPYFSRFVVMPLEGLAYSSTNLPAGLNLDPNTGLIYGTPLSSNPRHSTEVVISNPYGSVILPVVFEIK